MNEIDLIVKYLERNGSKVCDSFYFNDTKTFSDAGNTSIGSSLGYAVEDCWFFGNIDIHSIIQGTVLLTDKNEIVTAFETILKGGTCAMYMPYSQGVAHNMSLMGNGEYMGQRRLYGVGANKVTVSLNDFGAATFSEYVTYNGILFVMK